MYTYTLVGVNGFEESSLNHSPQQPHACVNTPKKAQDGNIFRGCLAVHVSLLKDVLSLLPLWCRLRILKSFTILLWRSHWYTIQYLKRKTSQIISIILLKEHIIKINIYCIYLKIIIKITKHESFWNQAALFCKETVPIRYLGRDLGSKGDNYQGISLYMHLVLHSLDCLKTLWINQRDDAPILEILYVFKGSQGLNSPSYFLAYKQKILLIRQNHGK